MEFSGEQKKVLGTLMLVMLLLLASLVLFAVHNIYYVLYK